LVIGLKQDLGTTVLRTGSQAPIIDFSQPLKIYPNPTSSSSTIEMLITEGGKLNIEVYNINGQLVANPTNDYLEEGIWQGEIGSELPSGFYFVRATINQQAYTLKFIKE
jgi:hypothetical protein